MITKNRFPAIKSKRHEGRRALHLAGFKKTGKIQDYSVKAIFFFFFGLGEEGE
jgi:hypothetical protein